MAIKKKERKREREREREMEWSEIKEDTRRQ